MTRRTTLGVLLMVLASVCAVDANDKITIIGEHLYDTVLESSHPYPGSSSGEPQLVWVETFAYPGAEYLVFQFDRFELAPGDWLEVRDPAGDMVHRYEGRGPQDRGGDFITKMILGPEAEIWLWSTTPKVEAFGFRIDRVTRGFNRFELAERDGGTEAICGADDKKDAVCYEASHPDEYEEGMAVARIVMDGSALCTAWLVSCENHVITNNHCTWDDNDFDTQAELDRMEFQFMYEDATCGGGSPTVEYSFMGGTWLENHHNLDYTLIQAPAGENPAATYGWLTIDYRLVDIDEQIYIVGHPSGRPKEFGLESTHASDSSGFCEVYSQNEPVCVGGSVPEIGYMCDTEGGNSGSPVLSRVTNKVVALHHCANCPNRGVRIQNVWDTNQAGSHPLPQCSLSNEAGTVAMDREAYGCSSTVTLVVSDESLIGTVNPQSVTIWSATEPTPETVAVSETPVGSGVFIGTILASLDPAVGGDGKLSVVDGDVVTVQYLDADDGQGGVNVPRQDAATVDCVNPAITSVAVSSVTGSSATVTWTTDELADSRVAYDVAIPPTANAATDSDLVTAHEVVLTGLPACTEHHFQVASADAAGNLVTDTNGGAYYGFLTGAGAFHAFDSADTPIAIPDSPNPGITSSVQVVSDYLVDDVNVLVNISHTYDGDLDIFLQSPTGALVELTTDNGGTGENFVNTLFDDSAATSITAGAAPFTGSYRPEQPLAALNGSAAQGTWTLRVTDDAGADTGTLNGWQLQLVIAEPCASPDVVFLDGFESGDVSAWDVSVP